MVKHDRVGTMKQRPEYLAQLKYVKTQTELSDWLNALAILFGIPEYEVCRAKEYDSKTGEVTKIGWETSDSNSNRGLAIFNVPDEFINTYNLNRLKQLMNGQTFPVLYEAPTGNLVIENCCEAVGSDHGRTDYANAIKIQPLIKTSI